jgi:hypothetical protein
VSESTQDNYLKHTNWEFFPGTQIINPFYGGHLILAWYLSQQNLNVAIHSEKVFVFFARMLMHRSE